MTSSLTKCELIEMLHLILEIIMGLAGLRLRWIIPHIYKQFKIFHCLEYGSFIIQEMYDGRWEIHYCEPGRYEETLFLSNDESEACEEYLRLIKKDNY